MRKKITDIAKTQITETIKSLSFYLNIMYFFVISTYTYSTNIILNDSIGSIGPHLKNIGICDYAIVLKEEKK